MIYLDSAATSLYKPESVQTAMLDALHRMASPGRGAHAASMLAADCCFQCRDAIAALFHVPQPEQVVFTFNATHALNIAIRSLVHEGTHVLISGYEHNSVTRPLHAAGAEIHVLRTPLFRQEAFLAELEKQIEWAEVVVCTHASNVFGYVLPIQSVATLCALREIPLVIDASQSAGTLELNFSELGAAFVAMPGHKGLMGPQGTGVLLCKNDAFPLLYGGSGSDSRRETMPDFLPDRLEAGTHNVAGIAGLLAGVRYIQSIGCNTILMREKALMRRFIDGIGHEGSFCLFVSENPLQQASVLSLIPLHLDAEAFAEKLNENGVAVRAGLHCAPTAHETVGTISTGMVRFSFSPFNTEQQIDRAAEICRNNLKNT